MMRTLGSLTVLLVLAACNESKREETSLAHDNAATNGSGSQTPSSPAATPAASPAAAPAAPAPPSSVAGGAASTLLDPSRASDAAPPRYAVRLETTKGDIVIEVDRAWAPLGADRFYNLVKLGYYNDVAFFRVIGGFMAQVGIHGDPAVNRVWRDARIQDDPSRQSNTRGLVSFATAGPNTRTTQFFVNFSDNSRLDSMGFSPFGRVRDMATVDRLYAEYGEGRPRGLGPDQGRIQAEGNAYLRAEFPNLDYIRSASLVE